MADDDLTRIAAGYRRFAEEDAVVSSPLYAALATGVADDEDDPRLPRRAPGGPSGSPCCCSPRCSTCSAVPGDPGELHRLVRDDGRPLRATMLSRATQTNEPARCAALLPVLAALPGPLASSRWAPRPGSASTPTATATSTTAGRVGPRSAVHLATTTSGDGPVPDRLPEVVARIGIDLHPLDPGDADDRAWLRALIWPGPAAADRLARLDAAAEIAAAEPARVLDG